MTNTLETLAARCEAATGPDRELDRNIGQAIGWHPAGVDDRLLKGDAAWLYQASVPAYTASLDAAMQLVPEGWEPVIDCAVSHRANRLHRADLWHHETKHDDGGMPYNDHEKGDAATPALALCAAALRAIANQQKDEPDA